ncbi:MAG: hypothetical protein WD607_05955 [Candidatus Paceibacterota bacterium]
MEKKTNVSGVSDNLQDSIEEQDKAKKKQTSSGFLSGKKVAISISKTEDLNKLGLSEYHLTDVSIEVARYLIVNGAVLLYGGDLREEGYTNLFAELSFQYKDLFDESNSFINYFPFPNSKSLDLNARAQFVKKKVTPIEIPIPTKLGDIDAYRSYKPHEDVGDRYVVSECLSDMRIMMAKELNARIVLGGKQKGFIGYLPGIVEETYWSIKERKPIYLVGGFGGATRSIIRTLQGEPVEELTNQYQYDTESLKEFKEYVNNKSLIDIDYNIITDFFKNYSIDDLSNLNGLDNEENEILFESTNIHEIVFLIIKGLKKVFSNENKFLRT